MFTKSYNFHVFEKKFSAAITLLKIPQERKKTQPGKIFFYVDRNYVHSRQPSFLLLLKKTHHGTQKITRLPLRESDQTKLSSPASCPQSLSAIAEISHTDRTPCLRTFIQFLGRLPTLLHDYKRRNSSSPLISTELAAAAGRRLRVLPAPTPHPERPLPEAASLQGAPAALPFPGVTFRRRCGQHDQPNADPTHKTSSQTQEDALNRGAGNRKPTYGSHRDSCSPTGLCEILLPSLRASCCPRLTESRRRGAPARHAETWEKLLPASASTRHSPSRVRTSPQSGFQGLRREKHRLPCLNTASQTKNGQEFTSSRQKVIPRQLLDQSSRSLSSARLPIQCMPAVLTPPHLPLTRSPRFPRPALTASSTQSAAPSGSRAPRSAAGAESERPALEPGRLRAWAGGRGGVCWYLVNFGSFVECWGEGVVLPPPLHLTSLILFLSERCKTRNRELSDRCFLMLTKAQLLHYNKVAQHSWINLASRALNKVLLLPKITKHVQPYRVAFNIPLALF